MVVLTIRKYLPLLQLRKQRKKFRIIKFWSWRKRSNSYDSDFWEGITNWLALNLRGWNEACRGTIGAHANCNHLVELDVTTGACGKNYCVVHLTRQEAERSRSFLCPSVQSPSRAPYWQSLTGSHLALWNVLCRTPAPVSQAEYKSVALKLINNCLVASKGYKSEDKIIIMRVEVCEKKTLSS